MPVFINGNSIVNEQTIPAIKMRIVATGRPIKKALEELSPAKIILNNCWLHDGDVLVFSSMHKVSTVLVWSDGGSFD